MKIWIFRNFSFKFRQFCFKFFQFFFVFPFESIEVLFQQHFYQNQRPGYLQCLSHCNITTIVLTINILNTTKTHKISGEPISRLPGRFSRCFHLLLFQMLLFQIFSQYDTRRRLGKIFRWSCNKSHNNKSDFPASASRCVHVTAR